MALAGERKGIKQPSKESSTVDLAPFSASGTQTLSRHLKEGIAARFPHYLFAHTWEAD